MIDDDSEYGTKHDSDAAEDHEHVVSTHPCLPWCKDYDCERTENVRYEGCADECGPDDLGRYMSAMKIKREV